MVFVQTEISNLLNFYVLVVNVGSGIARVILGSDSTGQFHAEYKGVR